MKHHNFFKFTAVVILLCGLFTQPSLAADDVNLHQEKSEQLVQKLGNKALKDLTDISISATTRKKRMGAIINTYFSMPTIGRFALGTHWRRATKEQQKEYMALLKTMLIDTYASRFEDYSGQTFNVVNSTKSSKRDTIVHSKITPEDGPALSIDWRVRHKSGKYKVIDVIVESISMSVTQRSDFNSIIQNGGGNVGSLITSLKKRNKNPATTDKKTASK